MAPTRVDSVRNVATADGNPGHQCSEPVSPCSTSDESLLMGYAEASDRVVEKTIRQYVHFVTERQRTVDSKRWERYLEAGGLRLYKERGEQVNMRDTMMSSRDSDGQWMLRSCNREYRLISAFGGGHLRGDLETLMNGLYVDDTSHMQHQAQIQHPGVIDCAVIEAMETEGPNAPHHFFGVKWMQKASVLQDQVDEICWVERMGLMLDGCGRPFGYQLVKSVDMDVPLTMRCDTNASRVNMSICYIYNQLTPDVTEVYIRGIVELPVDGYKAKAALQAAGDYMLAPVRAKACAQMKKITELIQRSKMERDQLMACHCSKVLRGLPKRDMCSECRSKMLQRKVCALGELDSLTLYSGRLSSWRGSMLASRNGYSRADGALPEDLSSYNEATSLRMLLPIRDPRPNTLYRAQRRDNVLLMMLRHYEEHRRRGVPESEARPGGKAYPSKRPRGRRKPLVPPFGN